MKGFLIGISIVAIFLFGCGGGSAVVNALPKKEPLVIGSFKDLPTHVNIGTPVENKLDRSIVAWCEQSNIPPVEIPPGMTHPGFPPGSPCLQVFIYLQDRR